MSMSLFFRLNGGGFGGFGGRSGGKKKKVKKAQNEYWFQGLTVGELKQLCKATNLKHTGNKPDLVLRLVQDESATRFAFERKQKYSVVGVNMDDIKQLCRDKLLQVSGNKLDLVLRILHHDHDSTPAGTTLKRSAHEVETVVNETTGETTTTRVAKKPKISASGTTMSTLRKPNKQVVYNKIQKKIESHKQKKFQSHYGSKCHAPEVYELLSNVVRDECISKGYVETDPKFALSIAEAAFTSLSDNFGVIPRPGYDEDDGFGGALDTLNEIVEAALPKMSPQEKEAAAEWMEELDGVVSAYGIGESYDGSCRPLEKIVGLVRGEKEEEDAKPPAEETANIPPAKKEIAASISKENQGPNYTTKKAEEAASISKENQGPNYTTKKEEEAASISKENQGPNYTTKNKEEFRGLLA
jgi:hypothetical protein